MLTSVTMDAIYEQCGSDWSHQVSVVATTQQLQSDQTLTLSAKGVACETLVCFIPSESTSKGESDQSPITT